MTKAAIFHPVLLCLYFGMYCNVFRMLIVFYIMLQNAVFLKLFGLSIFDILSKLFCLMFQFSSLRNTQYLYFETYRDQAFKQVSSYSIHAFRFQRCLKLLHNLIETYVESHGIHLVMSVGFSNHLMWAVSCQKKVSCCLCL